MPAHSPPGIADRSAVVYLAVSAAVMGLVAAALPSLLMLWRYTMRPPRGPAVRRRALGGQGDLAGH